MIKTDFCDGWSLILDSGTKREISIPHDCMMEESRSPENPSGAAGGYFKGGVYTYEKVYSAPKIPHKIILEFEGVYKNSTVYLNGEKVGGKPYGYIPFFVDLSDKLKWGEDNVITVVANNADQPNARWYTGSGIYRPVWLYESDGVCITPRGVKITTLSITPPTIKVETNTNADDVLVEILDDNGKIVATSTGKAAEIVIENAKLWSAEEPNLYKCRITATKEGVSDVAESYFGIRTLSWSGKGLFVNGKSIKLKGGCVHHDNGILGAITLKKAEERKVRIMKESGFNAIRSSHYPISQFLMEECDRQGMYVIDEAWDTWRWRKNPFDYSLDFDDNWQYDLSAMIDRDYNHPSVIMYSIGNEISDPVKKEGLELEKQLVEHCHNCDGTRPVTAGLNLMLLWSASMGMGVYDEKKGGMNKTATKAMKQKKPKPTGSLWFNIMTSFIGLGMGEFCNLPGVTKAITPACDALDIVGYNYGHARYKRDAKSNPDMLIVGSETFRPRIAKDWKLIEKTPNLIGDFQWAGWDYLGEAGCGAWTYVNDGNNFNKPYPWLAANSASIDLIGNRTAEGDLASAVWGVLKKPAIHVRPVKFSGMQTFKSTWRGTDAIASWSWKDCEGKTAKIEVTFDAYKVELIQDGKSLGKKKTEDCKTKFKTKYKRGVLEAIAYDNNGNEIGRNTLSSAVGELSIRLNAEENSITVGDIAYVAVDLVGENNVVESNADALVEIFVQNGELLAFGSANPRTEESYKSGKFTTYYGKALAIIKAKTAGDLIITAKSGEMESHATVKVR